MKTAIYIEDGDVQLVLTPDNEWEKNALKSFGQNLTVSLMRGSFYDCAGGWHRRTRSSDDDSVIIRVRSAAAPSQEEKK